MLSIFGEYSGNTRSTPSPTLSVVCQTACAGHLGHVFCNEPRERHCVNSLSIRHVAVAPPEVPEQNAKAKYDEKMLEALRVLSGDATAF